MMKTIKLLSLMLCLTASSLQAQPLDQQANYDKMSGRLISLGLYSDDVLKISPTVSRFIRFYQIRWYVECATI